MDAQKKTVLEEYLCRVREGSLLALAYLIATLICDDQTRISVKRFTEILTAIANSASGRPEFDDIVEPFLIKGKEIDLWKGLDRVGITPIPEWKEVLLHYAETAQKADRVDGKKRIMLNILRQLLASKGMAKQAAAA